MTSLSASFVLLHVKVLSSAPAVGVVKRAEAALPIRVRNVAKGLLPAKHARSPAFPGHVKSRQWSVNMGREVKRMPNWLLQRTQTRLGGLASAAFLVLGALRK